MTNKDDIIAKIEHLQSGVAEIEASLEKLEVMIDQLIAANSLRG